MLAQNSEGTNCIYNAISKDFEINSIVIEKGVDRYSLIKKRIKRFGVYKVIGQLLFQTLVVYILGKTSSKRIFEIKKTKRMNSTNIESSKIRNVDSINDEATILEIKKNSPEVIIVNGTRIISKKILSSTKAIFINTHVGITPKYRGVHGAYWALVKKDIENCGVTVHEIDEGIDTGDVIYQEAIEITSKDNFITYPYLQNAKGIELLKKVLNDLNNNSFRTRKNNLESNIWSHPTIFEYIYNRLIYNIK